MYKAVKEKSHSLKKKEFPSRPYKKKSARAERGKEKILEKPEMEGRLLKVQSHSVPCNPRERSPLWDSGYSTTVIVHYTDYKGTCALVTSTMPNM